MVQFFIEVDMENQDNIMIPNSKKVDQSPVDHFAETQISKKQKVNYWKISSIVFALLLLISLAFIVLSYQQKKINTQQNNSLTQNFPDLVEKSQTPIQLQTISLQANNLSNNTELIFSENNTIYSVKSDGLVKKIGTIDENISYLKVLPNNEGFFVISNRNNSTSKQYYLNNDGKPIYSTVEPCSNTYCLQVYDINYLTRNELVIAQELENGQADILLDLLDGNLPTKIGHLNNKPLEKLTCEIGKNCTKAFYPRKYVASFDGSYLLSLPPHGGGLGEPAVVISRDGRKVYKIDFYWYVSSAVWIKNNKLLTQDQNGAKIFTFNSDGTFKTQKLDSTIGEQFYQKWLSPDKKTLAVLNYNPSSQIYLFDIANKSKKMVVSLPSGNDPTSAIIIGWNSQSNQLLYSLGNDVKVYDTQSETSKTVANLIPPQQVTNNAREFALNIFDIR